MWRATSALLHPAEVRRPTAAQDDRRPYPSVHRRRHRATTPRALRAEGVGQSDHTSRRRERFRECDHRLMTETSIELTRWTGSWSDDDPDANFKADVALYTMLDPLETLRPLSAVDGDPGRGVGSLRARALGLGGFGVAPSRRTVDHREDDGGLLRSRADRHDRGAVGGLRGRSADGGLAARAARYVTSWYLVGRRRRPGAARSRQAPVLRAGGGRLRRSGFRESPRIVEATALGTEWVSLGLGGGPNGRPLRTTRQLCRFPT